MKVIVLVENRVSKRGLIAEHGLSYYIEANDTKLLFDTGAGPNFAYNAARLGIDISQINALILSHGHNDHTGGLRHFLEANSHAQIYLKKEACFPKFKTDEYIGLSRKINWNNPRFNYIDRVSEICPGVFIVPKIDLHFPSDQHKANFYTIKDGTKVPDNFDDELFLVLKEENGLSILSSCSHNGISNIVETASNYFIRPVKRVIGGFHLKNEEAMVTQHLSDYFNGNHLSEIYTCHCTGVEHYAKLKAECKCPVHYLETGDSIELTF